MSPPESPYGKRLFPVLVDEIAARTPNKPFVLLPKTLDPADGFNTVTYGAFAKAIDRCAWWIVSALGRSESFDTVSFMGHARDFRYPILLLAAVKAGWKAQFVSPKNSVEAHLSLLNTTDCKTMILPEDPMPIVMEILDRRTMKTVDIPSLESLLSATQAEDKPFVYQKTFEDARFEPLVVLQTSGSTGTPKAITATHGTFAAMDAHHLLPSLSKEHTVCDLFRESQWAMLFPFFHTGAYLFLFGYSIYYDIISVLPPSLAMSPAIIDAMHKYGNCNAAILPPSLIYPIFELPEGRERLSKMNFVAYAGGPLPRKHGDIMSPHLRLVNLLGSTETAMYPIVTHNNDWEYVKYSSYLGHEFRKHSDDLHEFVIVRKPELDPFQGVFCTFPKLDEYQTRELYSKHPTLKDYWKNCGRVDDVIAFSNGEKFNPVDTENVVAGHPVVVSCIATGRARFQASLIVEPKRIPSNKDEEEALLDEIWPAIMEANSRSIATGRITRDLVLFAKPDKPFPKTEKGTVKRALTEELYQLDLDEMYDKAGDINGSLYPGVSTKQVSVNDFEHFLLGLVRERSRKQQALPADEFSHIGLDSMQYASIVRDVNAFLKGTEYPDLEVKIQTLYLNSTVGKMAKYVEQRVLGMESGNGVH